MMAVRLFFIYIHTNETERQILFKADLDSERRGIIDSYYFKGYSASAV